MDKILISSCFLGQPVRYNGKVKALIHPLIRQWQQQGRFIAVCPEVAGGLPIPRPPAEIMLNSEQVITCENQDVSENFRRGAHIALGLCQKYQLRFALLKESSPSCGSTTIYDGTFSDKKISGQGLTARLLSQHGIAIFSEDNIEVLAQLLDN